MDSTVDKSVKYSLVFLVIGVIVSFIKLKSVLSKAGAKTPWFNLTITSLGIGLVIFSIAFAIIMIISWIIEKRKNEYSHQRFW